MDILIDPYIYRSPYYFHAPLIANQNDIISPFAAAPNVRGTPVYTVDGAEMEYVASSCDITFAPVASAAANAKISAEQRHPGGVNYRVDITPLVAPVFSSSTTRIFQITDQFGYIAVGCGPSGSVRVLNVDTLTSFSDEVAISGLSWTVPHRAQIRYAPSSNTALVYIDNTLVYTSTVTRRLNCGISCGVPSADSVRKFRFKDMLMEPFP